MTLTVVLLAYVAAILLPGVALAAVSLRGREHLTDLERAALALAFGVFAVPALIFLACALTFEPITPVSVLIIDAALLAAYAAGFRRDALAAPRRYLRRAVSVAAEHKVLLGAAAFACVYQFLFFDTIFDFHLTCTYFPCRLAAGPAMDGTAAGMPLFGQPEGVNVSLFYAGHQRMGITAVLSAPMVLFGQVGLRVQWGLLMAVLPLCLYAFCRRMKLPRGATLFAAWTCALLPAILTGPDQNRLILSLTSVLALARLAGAFSPMVGGLWIGLLYGAEPLTLLFLPGLFLIPASTTQKSHRGRSILDTVFGFAVGVSPFLLRYALAFKGPVLHEHFSYIPPQHYQLFGLPFSMHAFLNWPFRETLVRSYANPFPNLVLTPLALYRHFGTPLLAMILVGAVLSFRDGRSSKGPALALFCGLPLFALAVNENWTQLDKWSIVVMAFWPLFVWLAMGARWLFSRRAWAIQIAVYALSFAALAGAHGLLTSVNAPEDPFYRRAWSRVQFMPAEEPFYVEYQRRRMRALPLFPGVFEAHMPYPGSIAALGEQAAERNVDNRRPSLSDTFMTIMEEPTLAAVAPRKLNGAALRAQYSALPVSVFWNVSQSWTATLNPRDAGPTTTSTCTDGQPVLELRPFEPLQAVRVPWSPTPVWIGLVSADDVKFSAVAVMRTIRREQAARWRKREPTLNPCVGIALPPGQDLTLLDFVSTDPNRTFFYEMLPLPDGRRGVRLRLQDG